MRSEHISYKQVTSGDSADFGYRLLCHSEFDQNPVLCVCDGNALFNPAHWQQAAEETP